MDAVDSSILVAALVEAEPNAPAYYQGNLPRLQAVKAQYAPDNFFHFAQSIPLPV